MDIGYLLNAEIGDKIPPLQNGKIPANFLPSVTPESINAESKGASIQAIVTHEKALNPHPQYSASNHSHSAGSVGADPVGTASGAIANHIKELDPHPNYLNASRLATALSTNTWYNLTLVNGWTGSIAQYTKISSGLILLTGLLSKSGKSVGEIIATLPVGYRPSTTIRFSTCDTSKDSQPYLDINSQGQIIFNNRNPPNNTVGLSLSGIIYVSS